MRAEDREVPLGGPGRRPAAPLADCAAWSAPRPDRWTARRGSLRGKRLDRRVRGPERPVDQPICWDSAPLSGRAGPSTGSSPIGWFWTTLNVPLPSSDGPCVQRPAGGGEPSADVPKKA